MKKNNKNASLDYLSFFSAFLFLIFFASHLIPIKVFSDTDSGLIVLKKIKAIEVSKDSADGEGYGVSKVKINLSDVVVRAGEISPGAGVGPQGNFVPAKGDNLYTIAVFPEISNIKPVEISFTSAFNLDKPSFDVDCGDCLGGKNHYELTGKEIYKLIGKQSYHENGDIKEKNVNEVVSPSGFQIKPFVSDPDIIGYSKDGKNNYWFDGELVMEYTLNKSNPALIASGVETSGRDIVYRVPVMRVSIYNKTIVGGPSPKKQTKEEVSVCGKEENVGARFSSIDGQVEIKHSGESDEYYTAAEIEMDICYGDHIKTKEESGAILGFPDMSTFIMKEDTVIVINGPAGPESKLKLVVGNIWVNVKKIFGEGTMEIDMSQAVAGIKGTTFTLRDDGVKSEIRVLDGIVDFKSKVTDESQIVSEGEFVTATKEGLSEKNNFDIEKENMNWGNSSDASFQKEEKGATNWPIIIIFFVLLVLVIRKKI